MKGKSSLSENLTDAKRGEGGCKNRSVQWTLSLQYMGIDGFLQNYMDAHVLMTSWQAQGHIKADQALFFQLNLYQAIVCLNCMVFQGIYLIHKVINFQVVAFSALL